MTLIVARAFVASTVLDYVLSPRLAADLATLEWMLLAEKGGSRVLPEDARASAVAQIARLRREEGAGGLRSAEAGGGAREARRRHMGGHCGRVCSSSQSR